MDKSLWQTLGSFDSLHSSHERSPTILWCGNTAQHCRCVLFHESDWAGDLDDSKSTSGGILCIFKSRTFVPTSWMSKKQTQVSHSSTESEVISLDADLRMDGISALDLWDWVIEVFTLFFESTKSTRSICWVVNTEKNVPTKERRSSLTRRKILAGQLITSLQTQNLIASMPFFWSQCSSNQDDYQG